MMDQLSEVENISAISIVDSENDPNLLQDVTNRQRLDTSRSSDGSSDSPRAERSDSISDGQKRRKHRRHKGGEHHRRRRQSMTGDQSVEKRRGSVSQQEGGPIRHDRFRRGKPMAPYNTNQYLMEQHEPTEINLQFDCYAPAGEGTAERLGSYDSDGDYSYENGVGDEEAEENFLAKEFAETYQTLRAEQLQAMAKEDLIRELVAMETKVEQLESLASRLSVAASKKSRTEKELEAEVTRLAIANQLLTAEFDNYRRLHC